MTANNPNHELTPLEERAIRRFEHDRTFRERCQEVAGGLVRDQPGADPVERLQHAIRVLQGADEAMLDDERLTRGARYLGTITGVRYDDASVPFQESLKTAVRSLLDEMGY
jgi:hypothetical protein